MLKHNRGSCFLQVCPATKLRQAYTLCKYVTRNFLPPIGLNPKCQTPSCKPQVQSQSHKPPNAPSHWFSRIENKIRAMFRVDVWGQGSHSRSPLPPPWVRAYLSVQKVVLTRVQMRKWFRNRETLTPNSTRNTSPSNPYQYTRIPKPSTLHCKIASAWRIRSGIPALTICWLS